jgi:hypothetical protein
VGFDSGFNMEREGRGSVLTGVLKIGASVMPIGTLAFYHMGSNIIIAGLALLVLSFSLFIITALTYDIRLRRSPLAVTTLPSSSPKPAPFNLAIFFHHAPTTWQSRLKVLYGSSILLFARSIFRLVEYVQGNDGWLMRREWPYYVFDATLMVGVMIVLNVWHPGRAGTGNERETEGYGERDLEMDC